MSKAKIARRITDLPGFNGDAALYECAPPHCGHKYIVVSAIHGMFGTETYIFPADENGEVVDWGELPGSEKGVYSHTSALRSAGYSADKQIED